MRTIISALGIASAVAAFAAWWRRHPRFGSGFVNRVVDPWLVRQGVVEKSEGEIGLLEHVGRVSGVVRRSPVHPVPTATGYRIVVPLGSASQWARNVLEAGRCRLQIGSTIVELEEPALVAPSAIEELSRPIARFMDWLGFRYLTLRLAAASEPTPAAA